MLLLVSLALFCAVCFASNKWKITANNLNRFVGFYIIHIYISHREQRQPQQQLYNRNRRRKKTIMYGRKRKVSLGVGYMNDINVFYFRIVFPVPSAVCGDSQPTKDTHARQWLCVCVCACFVWRGWSWMLGTAFVPSVCLLCEEQWEKKKPMMTMIITLSKSM